MALKARLSGLRPWRLPLVATGLAIAVATVATYIFLATRAAPGEQTWPAGEALKLKLEFAFPAARR